MTDEPIGTRERTNADVLEVYTSDDYAGMVSPRFAFYYGYEETHCPHHGENAQCGCEDEVWCFTATHKGEPVARYTQPELAAAVTRGRFDEMYEYLLAGIGRYLN